MNAVLDPVASSLIAIGGAALFAWAAVHKLRTREVFAATLAEYQLVPQSLVGFSALGLGMMELASAAALLWPATRAMGGAAGAALLVIYAIAIAINLARGRRDLDCGCGLQPRAIGAWMVVRNLVIAALLCLLLLPASGRALGIPDFATIAAALIVGALLYASVESLFGRTVPRDVFSPERS
jgi:Methylamine utilisation protein MauE